MARTIAEIKQEIITAKDAQAELAGLNSTSVTAIWNLIVYIVATAIWTLEKLFDIYRAETDDKISRLKPPTLRWMALKAKEFQYGYDLADEQDYYDNTGIAEDVVAASKIITYASVVELVRGVRIKLAKTVGDDLAPLSNDELTSATYYLKRVFPPGPKTISSSTADLLKIVLRVTYNPLVLKADGGRIDGVTVTPVKDAIRTHLKNLPFNGVFSVQKMIDAIQAVDGVSDLALDQVQTKYGALAFTTVNISVVPDAGYLRMLDADFTVTYTPA